MQNSESYLKKLLLSQHSKAVTNQIIEWIGADSKRFEALMNFVLSEHPMLSQRAAWPLSYIAVTQSELIYPYLNKLLEIVKGNVHPAIKRNTFRFLKEIDIPEKNVSKTLDVCIKVASDPKETIAVICFSFQTLLKLTKKFPEIKNEVIYITECHQSNEAPAVKNTIKKLRKELSRI